VTGFVEGVVTPPSEATSLAKLETERTSISRDTGVDGEVRKYLPALEGAVIVRLFVLSSV